MYKRRLNTDKELGEYRDAYRRGAGNQLSLDYLRGSRVYGYYQDHELVGGYVICVGAGLRIYEILRAAGREPAEVLAHPPGAFAEITSVWFKSGCSNLVRAYAYISMSFDAFRGGQRYVLGASKLPKTTAIFMTCLPHLVYEGDVEAPAYAGHWWFYYGTQASMLKGIGLNFASKLLLGRVTFKNTSALRRAGVA